MTLFSGFLTRHDALALCLLLCVEVSTVTRPSCNITQTAAITTDPRLPHSYYFTTPILILKFVNKGIFCEEIQDSHFPRKRGYFGTHLREFGEKMVNFDVQCFTVKMGVHLGWKVSVLPQKRGFILHWKVSVWSRKRGCFELKSQCFVTKMGVIFKQENKDGYQFFQWVREPGTDPLTIQLPHDDTHYDSAPQICH